MIYRCVCVCGWVGANFQLVWVLNLLWVFKIILAFDLCAICNRTVEEFKKGHVDAPKIFNVPYMFNTPQGT